MISELDKRMTQTVEYHGVHSVMSGNNISQSIQNEKSHVRESSNHSAHTDENEPEPLQAQELAEAAMQPPIVEAKVEQEETQVKLSTSGTKEASVHFL